MVGRTDGVRHKACLNSLFQASLVNCDLFVWEYAYAATTPLIDRG